MRFISAFLVVLVLSSCSNNETLPVYGNKMPIEKIVNGKTVTDSIDYTIPPFTFTDQNGNTVDAKTIEGKIFVADFFFTSCPSICPKMKKEMLRVYEKYKTNPDIIILSYSIDPARDSVERLKSYSRKLGIDDSNKWHLLTGNKDSIYLLAEKFLVSAAEDPDAPGGHVHSGNFILVDKQQRIRGYYDGTKNESVDKLLSEIDLLLKEK